MAENFRDVMKNFDKEIVISKVQNSVGFIHNYVKDNPKRTAGAALVCVYLFSRFEARPKNLKVAPAQPSTEYVDIIPDILPNTTSGKLKFLAWLSETRLGSYLGIGPLFLQLVGIGKLRSYIFDDPVQYFPMVPVNHDEFERKSVGTIESTLLQAADKLKKNQRFRYKTCTDYISCFKSGEVTPREMAENLIRNIDRSHQEINPFLDLSIESIRKQANASTERYKSGQPLSAVDGVPVVVKDHHAIAGLIQRNGLELHNQPDNEDCFIVERMRAAGLIIVGHTTMTQRGFSAIGYNPAKYNGGSTLNPINPGYYPGGSSSGTAAAIASGLVPFGIGTDGGGSIRIPSSWSGLYGLKTTTGRCSLRDTMTNGTLVVTGPMAGSTEDLAILYKIISGPDPEWPITVSQPKVTIPGDNKESIRYKVGVDWNWARQADSTVFENFSKCIKSLPNVDIIDITVPELSMADISHLVIFAAEEIEDAANDVNPAADNVLLMNIFGANLKSTDFIRASRFRSRYMKIIKDLFGKVDFIANPSTANTAPKVYPGDEINGALKTVDTLKAAHYTKMGNLLGIPSVSIPTGYDNIGLPTSIMFQAKWFNEHDLLDITQRTELLFKHRKPQIFYENM